MKNLSLILFSILVVLASCTKSNEVHPELGDGNEEFLTVGTTTAHVEYSRADMAEQQKVVFHYCLSGVQQFTAAEMAKKEEFFELTLNDLVSDTLYHYYYEVFPNSGDVSTTEQKTFHTLAVDAPLPPTPPAAELPTVITLEVSEITVNSAVCDGEVTNDGGAEVTERGICWSTNANPTISDSHVSDGNGIGTFSAAMSGLQANTTYHVRAYATNEKGTAYSLDKEFTTLTANGSAPIGAIDGLFTINENGDQVYFSQGNLQYQASTNTWRFAENQWNCVGGTDYITGTFFGNVEGSTNNGVSPEYSGWIDLFKFGTSGYDHGAICYQPWSTTSFNSDYYAYGYWNKNLFDEDGRADWGYNPIFNGGNQGNKWRTPTIQEWQYIFYYRYTASGIRYAKAKVNGVNGMILLPDNWATSAYLLNHTDEPDASYDSNEVALNQWEELLEPNGAIFLPVTGYRTVGSTVCWPWIESLYSSASYYNQERVYRVYITDTNLNVGEGEYQEYRYVAIAVRLVQDANK